MSFSDAQIAANKALVARFHEPFEGADPDLLDSIVTPGWVNHPRNPGEAPGPEGFKQTMRFFRSIFDMKFTVEDVIAEGDKVVIRSICRATGTGDFMGQSVAGKKMAFTALEIHRFEGNRVAESWHLQDYYAMLAQLGAIPNVMHAEVDPYPGWA